MSIDFPSLEERALDQRPPVYEDLGKNLTWASLAIATGATIPANFKKKRVYTPFIPMTNEIARAALAPEGEAPEVPNVLQTSQIAKEKIVHLWTQIADGYLTPHLRILGREIEEELQVHPLALFIAMPKEKIRTIFISQNWFYRTLRIPAILDGFERGIQKALSTQKPAHWPDFWTLLPPFAEEMQKEERRIEQLIKTRDYQGLIHYLYDI